MHQLQPIHKPRKPRRIGRGGKKGTYSGRGIKGQRARTGNRLQPPIRELFKRYPKLRGSRRPATQTPVVVKLEQLEKHFQAGDTVNLVALAQRKIVGTIQGKRRGVKILDGGELTKPLTIEQCAVSKSARAKIEKAGGSVR